MAYDLDEQDNLDALKATWQRYSGIVTKLLILALIGVGAWSGWEYWRATRANQAVIQYEQFEKSLESNDATKILNIAKVFQEKFPSMAYAQMSALIAAKFAFEANNKAGAKSQLQWASEHGDSKELRSIATLRLAAVLLDEKAYDAALALLKDPPKGFVSAYAQQRGDILVTQKKLPEARAAYQLALDKLESQAQDQRQLIEFKLDMVGSNI